MVLVTGAGGFISSHVVEALIEGRIQVLQSLAPLN
jgi:nucleoside-diphosphate-sugar epimerase